jgi:hypothetical protein
VQTRRREDSTSKTRALCAHRSLSVVFYFLSVRVIYLKMPWLAGKASGILIYREQE